MSTLRPIVWLLLLAAACGGDAEAAAPSARGDRGQQPPREVKLARVTAQKLGRTLDVSGTLAADAQVTAGVKVAGRLASIGVDLGSVVKRGQVIARIETTDFQLRVEQAASAVAQARAQLGLSPAGEDTEIDLEQNSLVREAQASYDEARTNLERARTLLQQRMIAQAEFDAANAAFVRAQSGVEKARDEVRIRQAALRQRSFELRASRQQLADTVVRAPLDGIVQERHVLAGEYVAAGSSIVTIVRVDPLRMRVEVPERDARLVHVGQSVRVVVDGAQDAHQGEIVRLAPALDEQSRSLVVEAEVSNPGTLRPGSFARAQIALEAADAVPAVPASALIGFAGIDKVITVEDGKAVEKPVQLGRRSGDWVEIQKGVAIGDAVVIEPGNLQQGQPVRVASSE